MFECAGLGYGFGVTPILIFLILVTAVVFMLFERNKEDKKEHDEGVKNASDILKERYAKGEITKEEFDQVKKDIT